MAKLYLLFITCGTVLETWTGSEGSVFLPRHLAETVLRRQKRYNSGALEEMMRDNLERECIEERCTLEEAREVFENGEKTMEFWVKYIDGDQCLSSPCQNGGRCTDSMSSYVCWCLVGFNGKNCEIETARQCDVQNGGCMHFCRTDSIRGVECNCAVGYQLARNGRNCEPQGSFPCGTLGKTVVSALSTRSLQTQFLFTDINGTGGSHLPKNASGTPLPPSDDASSPPENSSSPPLLPHWGLPPVLPTVVPKQVNDKRIVGGDEVMHGEIPWQVALMDKAKGVVFCGGTILSELWVITAAHCLEQIQADAILIRVGENNVHADEGTEHDHEIAEQHLHPRYNAQQSQYNHDIALLRLSKPIAFSDYAIPVCLGPKEFTENLLRAGPTSTVSGWGRVRFGGAESPTLRRVELPYVERTECKGSSSDRITRFMFCAGYSTERRDSCQGDSGGPHTTRHGDTWFLTGIVSWGEECAKEGKFGIYTRVSRYYHWVSQVTGIKTDNPDDNSKS